MPATMTSCAAPTWAMCIASNGWRTQIRYCSSVLYQLCNFAILMQIDLPLNVFCMCVRAGAGGRACVCLHMRTIYVHYKFTEALSITIHDHAGHECQGAECFQSSAVTQNGSDLLHTDCDLDYGNSS